MSISDTTENAILNLVYNATAWTDYATNATAGSPETNISVSLQTATLLDTDTMLTSETTYTSYARISRPRANSSGGWAASSAGSISPHTTNIDFAAGTGGSGTVSAFATGHTGAGAQPILWSGSVSPPITVGSGVTPRLTVLTTITLD